MTLIESKFVPSKVGSFWGYFLDFTWIPKLEQYFVIPTHFWSSRFHPNPIWTLRVGPQGGPSGWALRVRNWLRVDPQGQKLGWYNQKI